MQIVRWFKTAKDRDAFIKKHDAHKTNKYEHRDAAKWIGFDEKKYPYSCIWLMPKSENEI